MSKDSAGDIVRAHGFGLDDMVAALDVAGGAFVGLLRSLDPSDGGKPVPNMTWTVAETAVHMLTILRRGLGDRRRSDTVDGLAVLNDEAIDETAERDVHALAGLIETDLRTSVSLLAGTPSATIESRVVRLHAGLRTDIPTALSYQLFDFMAHGWDIASATNRPWWIGASHAALCLRAALPALGPWVLDDVRTGHGRRAAISFPDESFGVELRTGEGRYDVRSIGRNDADGDVDAGALFLAVAGRMPSADPRIAEIAGWYRPI